MDKLTVERVKEIFNYCPLSGDLSRINGAKTGSVSHNGYLRVSVDGRSIAAQKVIWLYMTGSLPTEDIDHINHIRLDNRWANLREVSRKQNMQNAKKSKANSSGFTGVVWCTQQEQWKAQVMIDGKNKSLGRYDCKLDAVASRIRANIFYGFHTNHGAI